MERRRSDKWHSFYRKESSRYDARRYSSSYGRLFARIQHEIISEQLESVKASSTILELACGTGHVTALLQELGFAPLACDLTPEMMRYAREKCARRTPRPVFLQADAFRLPFPRESIDVVIATRFLHLFAPADQGILLGECARVLRSEGLLVADFDNWSAQMLMAIPHTLYNLIRYQRLAADTHYNTPRQVLDLMDTQGFLVESCLGMGGTHLLPIALASQSLATVVARQHRKLPLRVLAERFLVTARRR